MKKIISFIFFFLLIFTLSSCDKTKNKERFLKDISTEEATSLINENKNSKDFIIFDVRTEAEYDEGHLENTITSDLRQTQSFLLFLDTLEKNKTYLVYCRTDNRSKKAASLMRDKGFNKIYVMLGGFTKWSKEDRPIVKLELDKLPIENEFKDFKQVYQPNEIINFKFSLNGEPNNINQQKFSFTFFSSDHQVIKTYDNLVTDQNGMILFNHELRLSKGTYYLKIAKKGELESITDLKIFQVNDNNYTKPDLNINSPLYSHLGETGEESKSFITKNYLKNILLNQVLDINCNSLNLHEKIDLSKKSLILLFSPLCGPCMRLWNELKEYDFKDLNFIPLITSISKKTPDKSIHDAISCFNNDEMLKTLAYYDGASFIWESLSFNTTPKLLMLNEFGELINVCGDLPVEKVIKIIENTLDVFLVKQNLPPSKSFKIVFDLNGGKLDHKEKIELNIKSGGKIPVDLVPYEAVKEGYHIIKFIDELGNKFNYNNIITTDQNFKAVWAKNKIQKITVTFDLNGGTYQEKTKIVISIDRNSLINPSCIPAPTKNNFTFKYFVYENGEKFDSNKAIENNIYLIAFYEELTGTGEVSKLTYQQRETLHHFFDTSFNENTTNYLKKSYANSYKNAILYTTDGFFKTLLSVIDNKKKLSVITFIDSHNKDFGKIKNLDFNSFYNHLVIVTGVLNLNEFNDLINKLSLPDNIIKNHLFIPGFNASNPDYTIDNLTNFNHSSFTLILDQNHRLTDLTSLDLSFRNLQLKAHCELLKNTISVKSQGVGEMSLEDRVEFGEFKYMDDEKFKNFKDKNLYGLSILDYRLTDINGNTKTFGEITSNGKATLLVISLKGCGGCIRSAKNYDDVYQNFKDEFNLVEIIFNINDHQSLNRELDSHDIIHKEHFYCNNYRFQSLALLYYPTFLIIDQHGRICASADRHIYNTADIIRLIGNSISINR